MFGVCAFPPRFVGGYSAHFTLFSCWPLSSRAGEPASHASLLDVLVLSLSNWHPVDRTRWEFPRKSWFNPSTSAAATAAHRASPPTPAKPAPEPMSPLNTITPFVHSVRNAISWRKFRVKRDGLVNSGPTYSVIHHYGSRNEMTRKYTRNA